MERWCRLRGNLLFYFKSRDHWSEPAGVIVVEDCQIKTDRSTSLDDSTFGLVLAFSGGQLQHLATYTEAERDAWIAALKSASHRHMRSHMEDLRSRLRAKVLGSNPGGTCVNQTNTKDSAGGNEDNTILPPVIGKKE